MMETAISLLLLAVILTGCLRLPYRTTRMLALCITAITLCVAVYYDLNDILFGKIACLSANMLAIGIDRKLHIDSLASFMVQDFANNMHISQMAVAVLRIAILAQCAIFAVAAMLIVQCVE